MVRWGFLLDRILDSGAEKIATGHYVRTEEKAGRVYLKKGIDPLKDQSYVLSGLTQTQLAHSIFPLGDLRKTEVRELARKFHLPVAEKHDSQDLCFVGRKGYRSFLERHAPDSFKSGNIKSAQGNVIGIHNGLANYTIGQRKGIGAGFSEPMYVIEKDAYKNELVIGPASELGLTHFYVDQLNWIEGSIPESPFDCEVKIRFKSSLISAKIISIQQDVAEVELGNPHRDITPGQIAVFYQNEYVIGSGIIKTSAQGEN